MGPVNRTDVGGSGGVTGVPGGSGRGSGAGETGGAGSAGGAGAAAAVGGPWTPGVNLPALRSHNAALVLDLLRTAGAAGISRLELAERTGLTPQAVSKITARLRAEGLAAEAGRRASTGGKPRTVLRLVPEAGHAVGLHLDRDELTAVLCDLTGAVVAERRAPLDLGAGADAVVEGAAGEVEALLGGVSPLGVGVALPGPLDHTLGVLHRVTGFPEWDGFALRDALAGRLGLPVVVDKDTNAAALGVAVGAGSGSGPVGGGSFAYLHLGTGLGAGLVIGGTVHRGARTGAGEFGHQVIQLDGPLCECGNRGCIEVLCLDAVGRGTLDEAARVLGAGAANLVGLLDIDLVLLGGRTVAAHEEVFVRRVGTVLGERARREGGGTAIPVGVAPGGARGVAEGAAQLLLAPLFGRGDG
ncbi:ROK family transcriptional regulator [Streptomyces sp. NBC_00340]|uniref:ROK family transcriptional regulator n=1 Tax=Streptomyces sp. NBC_00340 TaxID=2975716 RepID=UPI002253DF13|nr:ROK family transcriptional regulator [Streptomyces sp. NBC_00340]MCX5132962.1 ROK family transcriptional regulator [Streptomyces sp. NBC_00340]